MLVLNIQVPHDLPPNVRLLDALLRQWPTYVAYVASFMTIGIMWINHHYLFNLIRRVDHWLLVFNTLLLFGITSLPFPTALLAEYIGKPDENVAAAVYGGTMFVIAILFNLLWRYASYRNRLLDPNADPAMIQAINRGYTPALFLYFAALVSAFFNVALMLIMTIGLAVFFALPRRRVQLPTGK